MLKKYNLTYRQNFKIELFSAEIFCSISLVIVLIKYEANVSYY